MRRLDFDTDKLQDYRLIQRTLSVINGLKVSEFDLILFLNPIKYFTIHDFKDGIFTMSWDKERFYRLQREGWIKKVFEGRGWKGGHSKYTITQKGKLLVARLGRIIDRKEDLPMIKKPENYAQRILNTAIKKYNNNKYRDYED